MRRSFDGYQFAKIASIEPFRHERVTPLEFMPQSRYRNRRSLTLHRYGRGPFCRFRIPPNLRLSGVYVLTEDGIVIYVGECENLSSRFNSGYGNISPRNCYEGGQRTNCKVNMLVLSAVKRGKRVELWFHETSERERVEDELVAFFGPAWDGEVVI